MFYFVKTPWWLKQLYRGCTWQMPGKGKIIYLTFDDGPHPVATSFVLDELKRYNAKASFFCIGKNIPGQQQLYKRIIDEGHTVGNHTHDHLNGWKTSDSRYMENISEAKKYIDSNLFRPPYGKITRFQLRLLTARNFRFKVIMWSVLSGDFDKACNPEKCLSNVIRNATNGSIVVFHDSEKAFEKLEYCLPKVLEYFSRNGFRFEAINM